VYQSDPKMIKEIIEAVTIPVMAKVRIGHFVEAQVRTSYHFSRCASFGLSLQYNPRKKRCRHGRAF
jgi:hypothetical protein